MICSRVVFPDPDGPSSANNSPEYTFSSIGWSTIEASYAFDTPRTCSLTRCEEDCADIRASRVGVASITP